ncbi:hypothetical protein [Thermoleptolyngbya sp. C42_A2020_037]|nr:hypothetical protein [Thermoleptolyngbya sp. C42_A2020_037]MBF2087155.1 hypothetical protein [Thermoleptolyngbya sp. C42_A2020_037]
MKRIVLMALFALVLSTAVAPAALARRGTSTCPLDGTRCVGSGGGGD